MQTRNRFPLASAAYSIALLVFTANASAQTPGRVAGEDGGWLQWVVGLGLAAVIVVAGFLNPKRTHLT